MSIAAIVMAGLVSAVVSLGLLKLLATLLWIAVLRRALVACAAVLALWAAQIAVNGVVQQFGWVPSTAYYTQAGMLTLFWLLLVVPFANGVGFLLAISSANGSDEWSQIEPFGWSGCWNWIFRQAKRNLDLAYVPPRLLVPEIDE